MNATTHPKRPVVLTAVIGVLAVLLSSFAATPAQAAATVTISGRVFLGDGTHPAGLDEVGISFRTRDGNGQAHESSVLTRTDVDGRYSWTLQQGTYYAVRFHYLGSGSFVDGVTGGGTDPAHPAWMQATTDTSDVDATLAVGGILTGRILTPAGLPAATGKAAIVVREFGDPLSPNPTRTFPQVYTASDGTWAVRSLPAGRFTVSYFRYDGFLNSYPVRYGETAFGPGDYLTLSSAEQRDLGDAVIVEHADLDGRISCDPCGDALTNGYVSLDARHTPDSPWVSIRTSGVDQYNRIYSFRNSFPEVEYRLRYLYSGSDGWSAPPSAPFTLDESEYVIFPDIQVSQTPTAPINTYRPYVYGTAGIGYDLTTYLASWNSWPTAAFSVRWFRCPQPVESEETSLPAGCSPISGASSTTYRTTLSDAGHHLTSTVTASNPSGSTTVASSNSISVPAVLPTNVTPPNVTGSPVVGATLTRSTGEWSGATSFVQAWLRCTSPVPTTFTAIPAGCVAIAGARGTTYVTTTADAGYYVTAQVGAVNVYGMTLLGAAGTDRIPGPPPPTAPANTVAPTVSGTPAVGSTWTVNTGTWTGNPTPTIIQAWLRCTSPVAATWSTIPAGCTAIPGARGTTYVTTTADAGRYLIAQVAGTNTVGSVFTGTANTVQIPGPPPPTAPVNTVAPTVSGATTVGSTWTLNPGTWTGNPAPTYIQAWLRCTAPVTTTWTAIPAGCVAISGARSLTYVTTAADAGKYLVAQVGAVNSVATVLTGTANTTAMAGPPPTTAPANTATPTVSGTAAVGSTWTLDVGTWTGSPTPTYIQAWLRCNAPVDATWTAIPAGCTAIPGARSLGYVTTAADAGRYLVAQVGAVNTVGTVLLGTSGTVQIPGPPPPSSPVNTVAPTVLGEAPVGSVWTVSTGTWTGNPTPTIVQAWLRCTAPVAAPFATIPAGCTAIPGARGATYVSTFADDGTYLTAQVGGLNSVGTTLTGAPTTVRTGSSG